MTEPTDRKDPIKVTDRRSFTRDGQRRHPDESPKPAEGERRREEGPGSAGPVLGEGFTMEPPLEAGPAGADQEAAFINLLVSIYQSGCIHLGLVAEPGGDPHPPDFDSARGAIEMLGMLKHKTDGNLTPEESRILSSLLAELQMSYALKVRSA